MRSVMLVLLLACSAATGAVQTSPWPTDMVGGASDVAAARSSGWYAATNTGVDEVEVRDIRGDLIQRITKADMQVLLPWMTMDGSGAGPAAIAFSDSGYRLYIAVYDDESAGDGQPGDAILAWDWLSDQLSVFARLELSDSTASLTEVDLAHARGRLYIGAGDTLTVLSAGSRQAAGAVVGSVTNALPSERFTGLAVDHGAGRLFAATNVALYRAPLADAPALIEVGQLFNGTILGMGWADDFAGGVGLYVSVLGQSTLDLGRLSELAVGQNGGSLFPIPVLSDLGAYAVTPTPCGRLLAGVPGSEAVVISEDLDPRLGFEEWVADEFGQHTRFARSLISPDGEPDGYVIDAQVPIGGSRFHPATPDAAGWAVMMMIVADAIDRDPGARDDARRILTRYAGLAGDGFNPGRAGGIYRHWIDPFSQTGAAKPGWDDEFATLSTMKIALAADRAANYWPTDAAIAAARDAIVGGVVSWEQFIRRSDDALYFKALPNGAPDVGSPGGGFNEGIMFVEQAAVYGGAYGQAAFDRWMDRSNWASASFIAGQPMSSNGAGNFLPAFVSLYALLVQQPYRNDATWQRHVDVLSASNSAWTDENWPNFLTVFSAGTTKGEWGGYNADDLGDHPGDITTFPSMMAFAGRGRTHEAVGAYRAYRRGQRQLFDNGAQPLGLAPDLLYRRSNVDPSYLPNTAGMPDVTLGALGLAELLQPGVLDRTLAVEFGGARCVADLTTTNSNPGEPGFGVPDGGADGADLSYFVERWLGGVAFDADMTTSNSNPGDALYGTPDGAVDGADLSFFVENWLAGCS